MKKLTFEHDGRPLEVRMVPDAGAFICYVWEGAKKVSSVPYVVSQTQVSEAADRGELDQVLDAALAEVRDTVMSGHLLVT